MEMEKILIIMGLSLVIAGIYFWFKARIIKRLNYLLLERKYQEFNQLLNSFQTRFFMNSKQIVFYQLNEAFLRNDKKSIEEAFKQLEKAKMSSQMRNKLLMQGLNYFVSVNDHKQAKHFLDQINLLENEQLKLEANILYNIYIEKGDKYLDFLLDKIESLDDTFKGVDEYLIALMYQNRGDHKNARKYEELSKNHIQMLDEYLKNKK